MCCTAFSFPSRLVTMMVPCTRNSSSFRRIAVQSNMAVVAKQRAGRTIPIISKRTLVTQLSPTTSLLRSQRRDDEVYLIGTAHVGQPSATEVTYLIDLVHPQTVFVESLDPARAAQLWQQHDDDNDDTTTANFVDPFERQLTTAAQRFAQHWPTIPILQNANEQRVHDYIRGFYQMLQNYGLVPGVDMMAAMRAEKRIGATLVHGDQHGHETIRQCTATLHPSMILGAVTTPVPTFIQTTLYETMQSLSNNNNNNNNKNKSNPWQDIGHCVEDLKTRERVREMTEWMQRAIPDTAAVLIQYRDGLMAQNLQRQCGKGRVVAVVGMAHMDGIEREWTRLERGKK